MYSKETKNIQDYKFFFYQTKNKRKYYFKADIHGFFKITKSTEMWRTNENVIEIKKFFQEKLILEF